MNNEIIRFEDSDATWEIKTWMSIRVEREYLTIAKESQDPAADIMKLAERIDRTVIAQTVAWSYGAVTLEVLQTLVPSHHYTKVTKRMAEIYIPLALQNLNETQNSSLSPIKQEDPSPKPTA